MYACFSTCSSFCTIELSGSWISLVMPHCVEHRERGYCFSVRMVGCLWVVLCLLQEAGVIFPLSYSQCPMQTLPCRRHHHRRLALVYLGGYPFCIHLLGVSTLRGGWLLGWIIMATGGLLGQFFDTLQTTLWVGYSLTQRILAGAIRQGRRETNRKSNMATARKHCTFPKPFLWNRGRYCKTNFLKKWQIPHLGLMVYQQVSSATYQGGNLPQDWKRGQVSLIYKEGPRSDYSNYCPNNITARTYTKHSTDSKKGDQPFDCIRALKDIYENADITKKKLHVAYINIRKAFDPVQWWQII